MPCAIASSRSLFSAASAAISDEFRLALRPIGSACLFQRAEDDTDHHVHDDEHRHEQEADEVRRRPRIDVANLGEDVGPRLEGEDGEERQHGRADVPHCSGTASANIAWPTMP